MSLDQLARSASSDVRAAVATLAPSPRRAVPGRAAAVTLSVAVLAAFGFALIADDAAPGSLSREPVVLTGGLVSDIEGLEWSVQIDDGALCATVSITETESVTECERGLEPTGFAPTLVVPDPDGPLWLSSRVFVWRLDASVDVVELVGTSGERRPLSIIYELDRPEVRIVALALAPDHSDQPVHVAFRSGDGSEREIYEVPGPIPLHPAVLRSDVTGEVRGDLVQSMTGEVGGMAWTVFTGDSEWCYVVVDVDRMSSGEGCRDRDAPVLIDWVVQDQDPPPTNDRDGELDIAILLPGFECAWAVFLVDTAGLAFASAHLAGSPSAPVQVIEATEVVSGRFRDARLRVVADDGSVLSEVPVSDSLAGRPWEPC